MAFFSGSFIDVSGRYKRVFIDFKPFLGEQVQRRTDKSLIKGVMINCSCNNNCLLQVEKVQKTREEDEYYGRSQSAD